MTRIFTLFLLATMMLSGIQAFSQSDSLGRLQPSRYRYQFRDSAAMAQFYWRRDSIRAAKDSILAHQDSVRKVYLTPLTTIGGNRFVDSLVNLYTVKDLNFTAWSKRFVQKKEHFHQGNLRAKGEGWVVIVIILLILSFAVVNRAFSKEISTIILAFYSNRVKEDNLFNSWPFLILYILFGFTAGMFLYLCAQYYQITYSYSGIRQFLVLSVLVLVLFTAKVILLKALAFFFDLQALVKEYISILYLSYFNAALLFVPLVVGFSLTPLRFAQSYIYLAGVILVLIFAIQLFRITANILTKYKFSKIYLFIYLCALEVCPLLVVVKALR